MTPAQQLATRFREVILNGTWIANTNFQDQLSAVPWDQASRRIGTLNSIAMLTFHIHYYIAGVLNVFTGGDLVIRDKYSFDLSPIHSREDWDVLRHKLVTDAEQFADHVQEMTDEKLESVFMDAKYGTWRRNIEGIIEHSYYHLGQVSLIRKLVLEGDS
ncbi:MAG: DinB family protein [Saprospiraceae bacterium]|nr:DinB family protein [Saprospiraceae bacterium]